MPVLIGRVSDEIDLQLDPIQCRRVLEEHFDEYWITSAAHLGEMVIRGRTMHADDFALRFPMKNGRYYAVHFKLDPEDAETRAVLNTPCSGEKVTNPQRKLLLL